MGQKEADTFDTSEIQQRLDRALVRSLQMPPPSKTKKATPKKRAQSATSKRRAPSA